MIYLNSFLFCGIVCLIGQIILNNTKLTTGHVTSLFVVIGAFLDVFDIYDKFIEWCGGGAIIPITSFGHLLIHGAIENTTKKGILGLALGTFSLTSAGISLAVFLGFISCLIFKPKH